MNNIINTTMIIIEFLQQNAEWMCAIAVAAFAGVQCWLSYQQNLQNIRLKRLELANRLDEVAAKFLGEVEDAKNIRNWLSSNTSNFAFLLNNKDLEKYKKLCLFILNYINTHAQTRDAKFTAIKDFLTFVSELEIVLGNANYGIVKNNAEFAPVEKGGTIVCQCILI